MVLGLAVGSLIAATLILWLVVMLVAFGVTWALRGRRHRPGPGPMWNPDERRQMPDR